MPQISVIIPVYNGAKTIEKTLESVFRQTFTDLEIIVVDDGSQDNTLEILEKIKDSRLKILSYSNGGASVARNRGLKAAIAPWVAFLDADDLWTPDKLTAQWQALQDSPGAKVAYSWTDYIDEGDRVIFAGRHQTQQGNVLAPLLVNNFLENGSNPLIERQILLKIGGFDESLSACQDWDLYLRLAAQTQFVAVPQPQILYRVSAHSITTNLQRQERETLQVLERAFATAPPDLQSLKPASLANFYKYLAWKALQDRHSAPQGWQALGFLAKYAQNEPQLTQELKFLTVMVLKSLKLALFG